VHQLILYYDKACATCHSIGLAGAPKFADLSSWGSRPDEGIEHLTEQVKNGLNGMPPMGMCMDCADEELTAAVQYMLDSL
jgi:cytochrome c5